MPTGIGSAILLGLTGATSMAVGAAPFAAAVGTAAIGAGAYGAYKGVESLTSKKEDGSASLPAVQPMSAAPTVEASQNTAKSEVEKLKKMRALAGGKTLLTTEAPTLGGGGKTLLGA